MNCSKNWWKYGTKYEILLKTSSIVNQCLKKNILKLKYGDKIKTNFQDKGMSKAGSHFLHLWVKLMVSVFKTSKSLLSTKVLKRI